MFDSQPTEHCAQYCTKCFLTKIIIKRKRICKESDAPMVVQAVRKPNTLFTMMGGGWGGGVGGGKGTGGCGRGRGDGGGEVL